MQGSIRVWALDSKLPYTLLQTEQFCLFAHPFRWPSRPEFLFLVLANLPHSVQHSNGGRLETLLRHIFLL